MPSLRQAVHASAAPKPNGNYSHVIRQGNTLHVAGWMGDDPKTGKIVEGGIEAQTVRLTTSLSAYRVHSCRSHQLAVVKHNHVTR